jgi:peptide/nickel transport system substrate-binding protein
VKKRSLAGMIAVGLAALTAVAAGCGGGGGEEAAPPPPAASTGGAAGTGGTATGGATKGGTYRLDWEASFDFTDNFDPSGEYLGDALGLHSSLLTRTLLGYKHIAGPEGNELIPDLAAQMPKVSSDGLTYTFKLKDGVKFGPPVSREITSKDVLYAFKRIGTKSVVAQYAFYYTPIKGMTEFTDGKAKEISGIETPDDKTIVFHLTEPTGDFLYRLSMPATGPIPEEVAKCFTKAGEYGRYVISSGPYMIDGSDKLDASSCSTMKPISGYQPDKSLTLVRNPDYDASTDTPEARENNPDRFVWKVNTNTDDIYNKVTAGELDDEVSQETAKVLRQYTTDASLKDRLKVNSGDRTWYISMNMTQPPFDDVHVRKAANLVMDKVGLQRGWGGSTLGGIATHVVPNTMFKNELKDFDPYKTPDESGDVDAAKAEMKKSKYDTNHDGLCDADVCKGVLHVTGTREPDKNNVPVIESSLAKIGITLKTRQFEDAYTVIQTVAKNIPIESRSGWGKDYADALTFFDPLFWSKSIIATGNVNYPLMGLTPEIAQKVGAKGSVDNVPSVDDDLAKCRPLTGDERLTCYENLDKKIMNQYAPWIPYLDANNVFVIGPAVTKWDYDQAWTTLGYAHVAIDPSKQK